MSIFCHYVIEDAGYLLDSLGLLRSLHDSYVDIIEMNKIKTTAVMRATHNFLKILN